MAAPPPTRLLLGTSSRKKLGELRPILGGAPLTLVTPADLGLDLDVEETGETFRDNAILKANAFARAAGLPALADDSGLEVDALDGAPGVRSARYAGPGASDADRIALLLRNLAHVPGGTAPAPASAAPWPWPRRRGLVGTVDGTCEGEIAFAPRGSNGFGYDPVFLLPDAGTHDGRADRRGEARHQPPRAGRARRPGADRSAGWPAASSRRHERPTVPPRPRSGAGRRDPRSLAPRRPPRPGAGPRRADEAGPRLRSLPASRPAAHGAGEGQGAGADPRRLPGAPGGPRPLPPAAPGPPLRRLPPPRGAGGGRGLPGPGAGGLQRRRPAFEPGRGRRARRP